MSMENSVNRIRTSDLFAQLEVCNDDEFETICEMLRCHLAVAKPLLLTAAAKAGHPKVKAALLELMGNTKAPEFVPYLIQQLESRDIRNRFSAFVALQEIGSCDAKRVLQEVDLKSLRRRRQKKSG